MSTNTSRSPAAYGEQLRQRAISWRENPERLAWIVMLVSFAILLALGSTLPWLYYSTIEYATWSQPARLSSTLDVPLLLYGNGSSEPMAVTKASVREDISEGVRIVSGSGATQGALEVVDAEDATRVLGSIYLYSNSEIEVLRIRRPFFQASSQPYSVRIRLPSGQMRVVSNGSTERSLQIEIETPQGLVRLAEGSFQIAVTSEKKNAATIESTEAITIEKTEVAVRVGTATLIHNASVGSRKEGLTVIDNESAWMTNEAIANEPSKAKHDLIRNGAFISPVLADWIGDKIQGDVEFIKSEKGHVAYFSHLGEDQRHTEVGISQAISQNVQLFDSVILDMEVKILFQSLPGAGDQTSEYPVQIELDYTDVYGKDQKWYYGFYSREPKPDEKYPKPPEETSKLIQQGEWFLFQSPNLITQLEQRGTPVARINYIRVYASGWKYQSMVRGLYLLAE